MLSQRSFSKPNTSAAGNYRCRIKWNLRNVQVHITSQAHKGSHACIHLLQITNGGTLFILIN